MNARRYLELAGRLVTGVQAGAPLTPGKGEPECRAAISRAYYATFLVARDFLTRLGIWVTPTAGVHTVVQHALNNSGVPVLVTAANHLNLLSTDRNAADYEPNNPHPEELGVATAAVALADMTIRVLDIIAAGRVTPPLDLAAVANTVLAWAKASGQEGKIRRL